MLNIKEKTYIINGSDVFVFGQVTLIQAFIHHIVLHGTSFIFFSTQRKAKSYAATVFYKFTASVDNSRHPFSGDCESKSYRW